MCLRRIELSRELGSPCSEALALGVLGDAYYGLGRYQEAADTWLQALPVFRDHGRSRYHALCLAKLGHEYEAMGRYPEAIRYLEQSVPVFRRMRLQHKIEHALAAIDRCRAAAECRPQETIGPDPIPAADPP